MLDNSDPSLGLLKAKKQAERMFFDGEEMHQIKIQTGWESGIDGKWRYEIMDPFHTTEKIEDHFKTHFGEPLNIRYCMHDTSLLTA